MKLYVLIATIDDGIRKVAEALRPTEAGVHYVVSWQLSTEEWGPKAAEIAAAEGDEEQLLKGVGPTYAEALKELLERTDLTLTLMAGRGLCRNRNHAMDVAMTLMDDALEEAVFIIADDDERLADDAFDNVRNLYGRLPKMDMGLWQMTDRYNGRPLKRYPNALTDYRDRPRSYYPSSVEMTFRSRLCVAGIRFDERFGLGSPCLAAGEEAVFAEDVLRHGLRIFIVPRVLCSTEARTTGSQPLDAKVLRSKGAVYGYCQGRIGAWLRSLREALALGYRHRTNPLPLMAEIWNGVKYIRK